MEISRKIQDLLDLLSVTLYIAVEGLCQLQSSNTGAVCGQLCPGKNAGEIAETNSA